MRETIKRRKTNEDILFRDCVVRVNDRTEQNKKVGKSSNQLNLKIHFAMIDGFSHPLFKNLSSRRNLQTGNLSCGTST